jgi:hypothetical protein
MAAPKGAGCFFGGDLQGEPKPAGRLPAHTLHRLEIGLPGRRSRISPAAGRGLLLSRGA